MRILLHAWRALLTLSVGFATLGLVMFVSPSLGQASSAAPASIANCNGNYPASYATFWHNFPWPLTGANNKEYKVKSPNGTTWVWIWGGETYNNTSSPKLPSGTYNSYDTQFLSSASTPRGAGRFVRERSNHKLYYTANHYTSWCYVGTQYG